MLVDNVVITVKAGNGGNGSRSFKRNAQTAKGGPDGGNGGNGGSLYFTGINDIQALSLFRYKKNMRAEDGIAGKKKNLYGRNGEDLVVYVPFGTRITELETNKTYEIIDSRTRILLAQGGKGGRGNNEFKSATNQSPDYAEPGEKGEEKKLRLELRLVAEIGFIGFPNAGKSSLLSVLTNAAPKIGAYPFTTLEPNLGVMGTTILADIPGLIEGASGGKGLGIKFLRHIEKTRLLAHCIDCSQEDVVTAYKTIRSELGLYSKTLLEKPEIILLTKTDLIPEKDVKSKLATLKKLNKNVTSVTIYDDKSIQELEGVLKKYILE